MITFHGNERSVWYYSKWLKENLDKYDVTISCQTTKKLPAGCLNIHYGVLPFYRGCNPIYWQMMNSEVAGVTLHWTDEGWDSGSIIDIYSFPHFGMTADEVYDECEKRGKELLLKHIDNLPKGTPQDNKKAMYYPKDALDFNKASRLEGVIMHPFTIKRIFATHFKGKQYPIINLNGVDFELRRI